MSSRKKRNRRHRSCVADGVAIPVVPTQVESDVKEENTSNALKQEEVLVETDEPYVGEA